MRDFPPRAACIGLCLTALAALVLAAGCANYRLGTEGKLSFHTLYIAPVENHARIPQAVAVFSAQIREAFLRDGRVSVVNSPEDADATLVVALENYSREVRSSRPDDTGLARKFDLSLAAVCTLRDRQSDKPLFEKRPLAVDQEIFTTATPQQLDSNQLQAEYQAVPLLASKLAEKTVHAVLDVW